jgi:RNA polymerase sigma-70 factor (ECF subfamily)
MPQPMDAIAREDLLGQARRGDADAFCELCRPLETRLLCQAMTLCGNPDIAEDLAQDTLVEAWKCLHRFNGRCQFFTWLCAILLNRHRALVRRSRWRFLIRVEKPASSDAPDSILEFTDKEPRPDQALELREQAALVRKCVLTLPKKHQQVIYLRFYVDDSLESIAAALNCSVGTVKSRLFHALEKLRHMKELSTPSTNLRSP